MGELIAEHIKYHSGFSKNLKKYINPLRKKYLYVENLKLAGEAPKRFIRIYEYSKGCKVKNNKSWPGYIAKVGIKSYPVESLTEHLICKIGEVVGLNMAHSRIVYAGNQIRYLSKYFLKKNERLIHGAEVLETYLRDRDFVQQVLAEKQESEFFTFKFINEAVQNMFPNEYEDIISNLFRMITFDCIIGSQDRHFYNWGIIYSVGTKRLSRFSPIYDTARGLFWNILEKKIYLLSNNEKEMRKWINNYIQKSKPCMGIENFKSYETQ